MDKTILITNDDGIESIGTIRLKEELSQFGRIVIVAPDSEKSSSSHSFSLSKPLAIKEHSTDVYSVIGGFPADCTYIGLNSILSKKPDLVISGINRGGNLGTDIYLSGTVAGARQAVMQEVSAISVSMEIFDNKDVLWDTGFSVLKSILKKYFISSFKTFLNINIPNVEYSKIKGYKVTRMGEKSYFNQVDWRKDPRNRDYCWIGGYLKGHKDINDSDCKFVYDKYVSITPLTLDITDYSSFTKVKKELLNEDI